MEELLVQLLGNTPTLIAVLLVHAKLDKRVALIEQTLYGRLENERAETRQRI